jgi:long-chain acyl-CoA synthetase
MSIRYSPLRLSSFDSFQLGTIADQLAYLLGHSEARYLFVATESLLARVSAASAQLRGLHHIVLLEGKVPVGLTLPAPAITWDALNRIGADLDNSRPGLFDDTLESIALDDRALLLYTSGTSGDPKGVPLTHRNVGVNGRDWFEVMGEHAQPGGIDALWLPMSHIFGFGELCVGNALAYTSYLCGPPTVLARLPEIRPSVFMSVPAYWEKLAMDAQQVPAAEQGERLRQITGGRLRFCLSGGAGLKRAVKEFFLERGILIIEGYGLTECSPTLTLNRPDDFDFATVGRSLPSVELRIADDGEILARGENIFAGYHRDPVATAAVFDADGWFHTGDVGEMDGRGFLRIVDRKKEILVTANGKNIPPSNIELRFRDDPLIEQLVVYGDGRKYLVAGVWLRPPAAAHVDDPVAEVARRIEMVNAGLARHEMIKRFVIIESPLTVEANLLTPSLKLRRKQIYASFGSQLDALYDDG